MLEKCKGYITESFERLRDHVPCLQRVSASPGALGVGAGGAENSSKVRRLAQGKMTVKLNI